MRTALIGLLVPLCVACQQIPKNGPPDETPMVPTARCIGSGGGSNRDDCAIDVVVNDMGTSCTVDVAPDQYAVAFDRRAGTRMIFWRLQTADGGYRFTPDGIAFKHALDPFSNFTDGKPLQAGRSYRWKNRNSAFDVGSYPYGIKVEHTAKNVKCELDPLIRNQ